MAASLKNELAVLGFGLFALWVLLYSVNFYVWVRWLVIVVQYIVLGFFIREVHRRRKMKG